MKLLADIGNSRLKWATEVLGVCTSLGNEPRPTSGTQEWLDQFWGDVPLPEKVVIANVAGPSVAKAIGAWVKQRWGCDVTFVVSPSRGWGVTNGYTEPKRLGADRWAKLVAVKHHYSASAFIVDFGTAVTMDVLDQSGLHHGGLIMPGLDAMRRALASSTQGVKVHNPASSDRGADRYGLLARDTLGGVLGGTTYALIATVERVAADVEAALGAPLRRIITGGNAPQLAPLLAAGFENVPQLVMNGLAIMASQSE